MSDDTPPDFEEFTAKALALFKGDDPEAIAEAFRRGDYEEGIELSDHSEEEFHDLIEEVREEADALVEETGLDSLLQDLDLEEDDE